MLTVKIEINGVETDRIDINNISYVISLTKDSRYSVNHYNFLNHNHCNLPIIYHKRKKGRFNLIEIVAKSLQKQK